jgi:hypothetical protein
MHERITALMNADLADLLLRENPRRVLAGQAIVSPDRTEEPAKRGFFERFRSQMS